MEEWDNTYGEKKSEADPFAEVSSGGASGSSSGKRNYERYLDGEIWSPEQNQEQQSQAQGDNDFYSASYDGQNLQNNGMPSPSQVVDYHGLEEPVSMGEWLVSLLIMLVPCVNIIMLFVWAFGKSEKKSKSNFFKALLIYAGVIFLIYFAIIILFVIGAVSMGSM